MFYEKKYHVIYLSCSIFVSFFLNQYYNVLIKRFVVGISVAGEDDKIYS